MRVANYFRRALSMRAHEQSVGPWAVAKLEQTARETVQQCGIRDASLGDLQRALSGGSVERRER